MKRIISVVLLLFLFFPFSFAQHKQLTLKTAVFPYDLYPEDLTNLQWRANSSDFVYIKDYKEIIQQSVNTEAEKVILSLNRINQVLKKADIELSYLSSIKWIDYNRFYIVHDNHFIIYNLAKDTVEKLFSLPEKAKNISYSPQANAVAYTVDNNLFYMDSLLMEHQITFDKDKGIVNGSDYVHRQEFGIDRGIFWSPNGNYIAFYRKDERMVEDYPVIDYTVFPAKVTYMKYPFAGRTSEQVKLGVYSLRNNEITYMETGQPADHYLTSITWDPSEKYIYIGILNRDQNHLWLNKYDIYNGQLVKTLFEEQNPKYVEPLHPLYFVPKHPDKFLYFSQRDGWQQLYLYDTDGNLIRQLTKGPWEISDIVSFSQDGRYVFVISTKESPIQRHGYRVDLKTGKMTKLTADHGTHRIIPSANGKYIIDKYSSTDVPRKILLTQNGKVIRTLLNAPNPLEDYEIGKMRIGTLTAADGHTKLYYRIILPPDFNPNKKYPVVVYVYGGPHAQLVLDTYLGAARMWDYYMAQKGYIMFTLDNRGSDNRGFDFESVIYRHLGVNEMKDQLKGVDYLKSLPYVDTTRIGVHGWSFGGFMTTSLMTTYPDVFKVGVAGGPVIDWSMYEVMYGERYMDTPQSNPEGYEQTSVLNKIANLKGHLLIIHGQIDPVVVPQNTMRLLMKAQKLGVQVDYYPYPHQEHGVRGIDRLHLMQKITNYFDLYL